jgi:CxxC motif-containing protein
MGCHLEIEELDNGEYKITGNQCKRGIIYAQKELTNPTRVLPTTVKIKNGPLRRLPVRTNGAIPKGKIFEAMDIINKVEVEAPIKMGDVVVANILNTGIDVIASRTMEKR